MSALGRTAPGQRRRIAAERLPGVRRDLSDLSEFYARYRGPRVARRVGSAVNDHYLRANGVSGGVQNYQYSARLLVTFARENGGHIMPDAAASPDRPESKGVAGAEAVPR
jgi:hypothetical protein